MFTVKFRNRTSRSYFGGFCKLSESPSRTSIAQATHQEWIQGCSISRHGGRCVETPTPPTPGGHCSLRTFQMMLVVVRGPSRSVGICQPRSSLVITVLNLCPSETEVEPGFLSVNPWLENPSGSLIEFSSMPLSNPVSKPCKPEGSSHSGEININ